MSDDGGVRAIDNGKGSRRRSSHKAIRLGKGWHMAFSDKHQMYYYFNVITNERTWTEPEEVKKAAKSSSEWTRHFDPRYGRHFYYNTKTKQSTWENPKTKVNNEKVREEVFGDGASKTQDPTPPVMSPSKLSLSDDEDVVSLENSPKSPPVEDSLMLDAIAKAMGVDSNRMFRATSDDSGYEGIDSDMDADNESDMSFAKKDQSSVLSDEEEEEEEGAADFEHEKQQEQQKEEKDDGEEDFFSSSSSSSEEENGNEIEIEEPTEASKLLANDDDSPKNGNVKNPTTGKDPFEHDEKKVGVSIRERIKKLKVVSSRSLLQQQRRESVDRLEGYVPPDSDNESLNKPNGIEVDDVKVPPSPPTPPATKPKEEQDEEIESDTFDENATIPTSQQFSDFAVDLGERSRSASLRRAVDRFTSHRELEIEPSHENDGQWTSEEEDQDDKPTNNQQGPHQQENELARPNSSSKRKFIPRFMFDFTTEETFKFSCDDGTSWATFPNIDSIALNPVDNDSSIVWKAPEQDRVTGIEDLNAYWAFLQNELEETTSATTTKPN